MIGLFNILCVPVKYFCDRPTKWAVSHSRPMGLGSFGFRFLNDILIKFKADLPVDG